MFSVNSSKPTELALATYGTPLRKPVVGWIVAAALTALIGLAVWRFFGIMGGASGATLRVFVLALLGAGAISILPVLLLRWLDRREPELWFMYLLAFLWGSVIATGIAVYFNTYFAARIGTFTSGVFTSPLVEEGAKGLGLLVLLLVMRGEFDGPRDGLIYGVLIGLGFNWLESAVYIANGYHDTGTVNWGFQVASRYALLGFSGHGLYTGVTGTFVGFALLQRTWPRRIGLVLLGYLLAALNHMGWNGIGIYVSGAIAVGFDMAIEGSQAALTQQLTALPLWITWPASILATLIVNLAAFVVVIVGLKRSGSWEKQTMVEQLRDDVGTPVVTAAEYANITGRCEPPKDRHGRRIFAAQCNLAKRAAYLARRGLPAGGDPIVAAWQNDLRSLRSTAP